MMYEHPMYSALSMLVHGKALYKNIIIILLLLMVSFGKIVNKGLYSGFFYFWLCMTYLGTLPTYANLFVSFCHMIELCRNR